MALLAAMFFWLVMSLISGLLLPLGALTAQILMTAAVYPLVSSGFAELHRRVIVEV